ncbi:MAG: type II toxin-antitoxin system HicA family toxin [Bacteroidales bacterium]|nr:type II toxin-antitoxin system HicA family toxin [Bacteroidales bacterium]
MKKLSNITLKEFRAILQQLGLQQLRIVGGHEIWTKPGLQRTIVFQTHVEPLPEFVVKNAIRDLGMTRQEFMDIYENM